MRGIARKLALTGAVTAGTVLLGVGGTAAPVVLHHTIIPVNMSQSGNWSGYNIGTLSYKDTLFSSITGEWRVPTVSLHKVADGTEYSANWIGIGGGCIDSGCTLTDSTLIQTGTEQDASTKGNSYSAWWEVIPAPSLVISGFKVGPGDLMFASIAQAAPEVWTITLKDLSRKESFSQTVPYTSSELTAEWITETPVVINGAGTGIATMPNLSGDKFDLATVNGKPVSLSSSYAIQLNSNGKIEATPSAPDSDHDGFNDCSYTTSCSATSS